MSGAVAPVDIALKVKGLSELEKVTARMEALEKEVTRLQGKLPKTANDIAATGRASKGAAVGVRGLGTAFKAALGPIGAALSAISGLTAAFGVLKGQDFSEAKFASLGGNADQLVTNLESVSKELNGQRSVAELTGAAYDVASAGFSSAAEASLVLKAASQGAAGGFSDLNTVGNATTSVLNAYKLSAADATSVVDQFIQTQNDGKIIVAEYASNIGKVASAAAGLGIPLSEVNAVIAQSTAAGVQAEVAFTGLKGALARLATGEATKALKGTGIEIDAASLKSDGLFKTLKKLEGLDTGQIFAALGTEAGPALLPVIQNLEKYEELLKNQKNANGTAAAAAATASGTIEGAWKRVTVAFQNLFSDQTELGQIIRATLLAAAATVEAFGAAFKIVVAPVRAVIEAITRIASAMTGVKNSESILTSFTNLWFDAIAAVEDTANTIVAVGAVVGDRIGSLVDTVGGWFSSLFGGINQGAQTVIPGISGAFSKAFGAVKEIIEVFWNSLPEWLKGALNKAGSIVGGIVGAVKNALGDVVKDIQSAKAQVEIKVPAGADVTLPEIVVPTGGGSLDGGGGGGGGAAAAPKTDNLEALQRQLDLTKDLITFEAQKNKELLAGNEMAAIKIDGEIALRKLQARGLAALANMNTQEGRLLQTQQNQLDVAKQLQANKSAVALQTSAEATAIEDALRPLQEQKRILEATLNGRGEEERTLIQIENIMKNLPVDQRAVVEGLVRGNAELQNQLDQAAELEQLYAQIGQRIADGLVEGITAAIDGTKSLQEVLADVLKDLGKMFLKFGVNSAFGGLGLPGFANGGRPEPGKLSIVGEKGPELFLSDTPGTVLTNDQAFDAARDAMGGGGSSEAFSENADALAVSNSYTRERVMEKERSERSTSSGSMLIETQVINNVEYATVDQLDKAAAASAKQARAQVFSDMKNRPATRRQLGIK